MENSNEVFKYYMLYSFVWTEKSIHKFANKDKAIEYAKNSDGYYCTYDLYEETWYEDEKGKIKETSKYIGTIPNKAYKTTEYYILGETQEGKDPIVVECYKRIEDIPSDIIDGLDIYKVTVTLNDEKLLEYSYDLLKRDQKLIKK